MLTIDGSQGEGGGQVLRSCLALSVCLGKPFRITHIRSNRKKPGLKRQHRTSVLAAAQISSAQVSGAELDSQELTFIPQTVVPGQYRFDIGSAGSTTLVLQTILPPLLTASGTSRIVLSGGTHNPMAPPFDFLEETFLPLIRRMGPQVTCRLHRAGYFPAGGGEIEVEIHPSKPLHPLNISERGDILECRATATVVNLPKSIADRELKMLKNTLGWKPDCLEVHHATTAGGAANVLTAQVRSQQVCEVFTGFGQQGVRAETVAHRVSQEVQQYLDAGVPVGTHLADQLLIPLALAGGGSFRTLKPSVHTTTNIDVIEQFTGIHFVCKPLEKDVWRITISTTG